MNSRFSFIQALEKYRNASPPAFRESITKAVSRARFFSFDMTAMHAALSLCENNPVAVFDAMTRDQSAVMPFDFVQIELPCDETMRTHFLISPERIFLGFDTGFSRAPLTPNVIALSPVYLHRGSLSDELIPELLLSDGDLESYKLTNLNYLLGPHVTTYLTNAGKTIEELNIISDYMFPTIEIPHVLKTDSLKEVIKQTAGMPVMLFAALTILNQYRPCVTIHEQAATRTRVGNKFVGVPKHHRITVDLDRMREQLVYEASVRNARSPSREHDVRGHWVHYGLTEGCQHQWTNTEGLKIRQRCASCGGKRTFRPAFKRGDPTLGTVTTHYEVKQRGA